MKKEKIKFIIILFGAIVASLGTYPYAKNFPYSIFTNPTLISLSSIIFIVSTLLSNVALGTYSLHYSLKQHVLKKIQQHQWIVLVCIFSALANGFMCFIGFRNLIPDIFNIFLSIMVLLVNAGIGFSATIHFIDDIKETNGTTFPKERENQIIDKIRLFFLTGTTIVSFGVTLTAYLASTQGLYMVFNYYNIATNTELEKLIYFMAIIIWLPGAFLFAYGSRTVVNSIFKRIINKQYRLTFLGLIILLIAIASGSAYAQMVLEFFDVKKYMPEMFREIAKHSSVVFYMIMPLAFIISSTVNAYALGNLLNKIKNPK